MSRPTAEGEYVAARYRVAVVGAGSRAANHIACYAEIPEAQVVAVADRSGRRSPTVAAHYGLRAYQDVGEMLERERPHLVHVVTGPEGRVHLMEQVAAAGVPLCTVEKPVAVGVSDYRRLCTLAATSSTRFAVSHQFSWHPTYVRLHEAIAAGDVGAVRWLEMSAGMSVTGQGTHILHYGMAWNGASSVTRVFGAASGWDGKDPDHPGPRATEAELEFANGARGLWLTGAAAPRVGQWSTVWQHVRLVLYGTRGSATWEEFGDDELTAGLRSARSPFGGMDAWRRHNLTAQAGFHRAMLHWLDHPRDPPSTALEASLHEWKVVLALYESALTRRMVDVATFEPEPNLVTKLTAALTL